MNGNSLYMTLLSLSIDPGKPVGPGKPIGIDKKVVVGGWLGGRLVVVVVVGGGLDLLNLLLGHA